MQNLSEIKRKNIAAYHRLMHDLYLRVTYVLSHFAISAPLTNTEQWRIKWVIWSHRCSGLSWCRGYDLTVSCVYIYPSFHLVLNNYIHTIYPLNPRASIDIVSTLCVVSPMLASICVAIFHSLSSTPNLHTPAFYQFITIFSDCNCCLHYTINYLMLQLPMWLVGQCMQIGCICALSVTLYSCS